jgi:hypothetical protein
MFRVRRLIAAHLFRLAVSLWAAVGIGAGAAYAEPTRINVDGYLYAVGEAADYADTDIIKLRRSTMVATFAARDVSSPHHLANYRCAFVSHTTTDTQTRHQVRVGLTGACLVTDRAGDSYVAEWHRVPGQDVGEWVIVRGSGKYENAAGTGTYTIMFLAGPPSNPQLRFTLVGRIDLG